MSSKKPQPAKPPPDPYYDGAIVGVKHVQSEFSGHSSRRILKTGAFDERGGY